MTLNAAVTEALAFRATAHVPVPLHAPDQPANVEPVLGVAVSVTDVPPAKLVPHVCPQLIPEGLLATIPFPVPVLCTVSWKLGIVFDPQPQRMAKGARHQRTARYLWLQKYLDIGIIPPSESDYWMPFSLEMFKSAGCFYIIPTRSAEMIHF